jgi:hypothetical protein
MFLMCPDTKFYMPRFSYLFVIFFRLIYIQIFPGRHVLCAKTRLRNVQFSNVYMYSPDFGELVAVVSSSLLKFPGLHVGIMFALVPQGAEVIVTQQVHGLKGTQAWYRKSKEGRLKPTVQYCNWLKWQSWFWKGKKKLPLVLSFMTVCFAGNHIIK